MWLLFAGLALLAYFGSSQAQVVAFSARKVADLSNVTDETIVIFEEVAANSGEWYDTSTGQFNGGTGNAGNYYHSFSIGIPRGRTTNTGLFWTNSGLAYAGLEFTNTFSNGSEYSSRGYMQNVGSWLQDITLRMAEGSYLLGSPEYTTSWTVFKYADEEAASVAFSVARNIPLFGSTNAVTWGRVFINDGGPGTPDGPMEPATGFFVAPRFGYYFFHFSAGSVQEQPVVCFIVHWPYTGGTQDLFSLTRTATSTIGTSTISRSVIVQLEMYDRVTIGNDFGSYLDSTIAGVQTSFSGFLYSLQISLSPEAVVFCAYMQGWDYVGDDGVIQNWMGTTANMQEEGEPFDMDTGVFTAPLASTYFFSFSIGIPWRARASCWLTTGDGEEIAHIVRENSYMNGVDTLSRDVLLDLAEGDTIKMHSSAGSTLTSSLLGRETAFLGFLIRS